MTIVMVLKSIDGSFIQLSGSKRMGLDKISHLARCKRPHIASTPKNGNRRKLIIIPFLVSTNIQDIVSNPIFQVVRKEFQGRSDRFFPAVYIDDDGGSHRSQFRLCGVEPFQSCIRCFHAKNVVLDSISMNEKAIIVRVKGIHGRSHCIHTSPVTSLVVQRNDVETLVLGQEEFHGPNPRIQGSGGIFCVLMAWKLLTFRCD
mmetsp:Transcript_29804/g.43960  ORF Transcript_29804/g.43960 Transcript_29804/m.43960 type:complete len:202 (+) Transcript_29804:358-963(+)